MEKYVVYIAHKDVYHWGDKPKPLKAQNLIEALKEIKGLCEGDINIYVIYLYEKTSRRNEYDLLMKSFDGKFFCVVELKRHSDFSINCVTVRLLKSTLAELMEKSLCRLSPLKVT